MRWLLALAIVGAGGTAEAHPLDMGYLRLDTDRGIAITFDFDVNIAAQILHVEPMTLDATTVAARATEIADATYHLVPPMMGDTPCTWSTPTARLVGRSVSLSERPSCVAGTASWDLPFIKKMSATFQVLAKVRTGGEDTVVVLDKSNTVLSLSAGSNATFGGELWAGIVHVGLAPAGWRGGGFPPPIQHLVLIVALVLAAGSILRMLGAGGAYAAGHAAGVALSFAVSIPGTEIASWVIAAAVAAIAVSGRYRERVWIVAGAAGVVHGAGVAVAHSASALIAFSLGIGLAQLAVMLVIGPPVVLLRKPAPG